MSTRLGMADGRLFTDARAHTLANEQIAQAIGIQVGDNYAYRQFLQQNPEKVEQLLNNMGGYKTNKWGA